MPSSSIPTQAGLCATCRHPKLITSAKGGVFILCQAHQFSHKLPKYPPLPVTKCSGYVELHKENKND